MSKIIEALKTISQEPPSQEVSAPPSAIKQKTGYELTQEQLAEIYFSSAAKLKRSDQPLLVQVVQRPGWPGLIPWIITSVAFLITAFSLFSTKRIFVDIHVVDEKPSYLAPPQAESRPRAGENGHPAPSKRESSFVSQRISMQNAVFEGAAKLNSSSDKNSLTLVNSSLAPFARSQVYLEPPLNLTAAKVAFYAKGAKGGENVALAVKDRNNLLGFPKGKIYPFPEGLTADWQRAEISLEDAPGEFDKSRVVSLRFDFGSKDTANKPGDTVFVKDVQTVSL